MTDCACGSGTGFDACCGPFLEGKRTPATAVELLRSRYTAFCRKDPEYVLRTTHPDQLGGLDQDSVREWAEKATFKALEIYRVDQGTADDDEAWIDFIARYEQEGEEVEHSERAHFVKHEGAWVFDHRKSGTPQLEARDKVGRNDPCPCGSGKKYKKCCGKAA